MNATNTTPTTSTSVVHTDDVVAHSEMLQKYLALDQKLVLACRQLKALKLWLADLQCRYDHSFRDNLHARSFQRLLRLRMCTLRCVAWMFYEYAARCSARLDDMQAALQRLGLLSDSDDVSASEYSLSNSDDVSVSDTLSENWDLSANEFE